MAYLISNLILDKNHKIDWLVQFWGIFGTPSTIRSLLASLKWALWASANCCWALLSQEFANPHSTNTAYSPKSHYAFKRTGYPRDWSILRSKNVKGFGFVKRKLFIHEIFWKYLASGQKYHVGLVKKWPCVWPCWSWAYCNGKLWGLPQFSMITIRTQIRESLVWVFFPPTCHESAHL